MATPEHRDYSQWFSDAILPFGGGNLSLKERELVGVEQDVRHLFVYLTPGAEDIDGRGEYGELKASPKFYEQLACEFMDFATLHPGDAAQLLAEVFRLIEMQPLAREQALKERGAPKKCCA